MAENDVGLLKSLTSVVVHAVSSVVKDSFLTPKDLLADLAARPLPAGVADPQIKTRLKALRDTFELPDGPVPEQHKAAHTELKKVIEKLSKEAKANLKDLGLDKDPTFAPLWPDGDQPTTGPRPEDVKFTAATAALVAGRFSAILLGGDQALALAAAVATDTSLTTPSSDALALRDAWSPWAKRIREGTAWAADALNSAGSWVGLGSTAGTTLLDSLSWDTTEATSPKLHASVASLDSKNLGMVTLSKTSVSIFFGFTATPQDVTDEQVAADENLAATLVKKDGKWTRTDEPVFGVTLRTTLAPALGENPLMKGIVPKQKDAKPAATAFTIDSVKGAYFGEKGKSTQRTVLPIVLNFGGTELREFALILRRSGEDLTAVEVSLALATTFGEAVGLFLDGIGIVIRTSDAAVVSSVGNLPVAPRWPDRIGVKINAGPVKGGGYFERVVRTYGTGDAKREVVEFGGAINLELLGIGVFAFGILAPDPFSMVVVAGVRFGTRGIDIGFGFTLAGIGGLLAVNRTLDTGELVKAMKEQFLDKVLLPTDPVSEAPTLLGKVATVFPPKPDHFVVGLMAEFGWGTGRMLKAKLAIAITLPDVRLLILGALRVTVPDEKLGITDLNAELLIEVTGEHVLLIARLVKSTIATMPVSGDLGLLIQWGGGGAFALSVGGFHPDYRAVPPQLKALERLTIDLSPPVVVRIVVQIYFALTAGAVMLGVRGDLKASLGPGKAHAWLQLDILFEWTPRFAFRVDLQFGISIKVFGVSFASISFTGTLRGTTPWMIRGYAKVDVWWLPTFELDIGPIEWGSAAPPLQPGTDAAALVRDALSEPDAWSSRLPAGAAMMVALRETDAGVEAGDDAAVLLAHPLSFVQATQSVVPLETHLDRVGSAGVLAHRVHLGMPTTSQGPMAAIATVRQPFAPGAYLDLPEEARLSRSGFEDLPSGVALTPAALPVHGTATEAQVRWRTYLRRATAPVTEGTVVDLRHLTPALLQQSHRTVPGASGGNPYLADLETTAVGPPPIEVLPFGAARLHDAATGADLLAPGQYLGSNEAGRIAADLAHQWVAVAVGAGHA